MRSRPWETYYGNTPSNLSYPNIGMYKLISNAAKKFADKPAYGFMGSTTSFEKMMEEIDTLSEALALYDVKKGDIVVVCLPNCPQAIWSVYAVNRCGAISKMVYPLSSKNEIREQIISSRCKLAIVIDSIASEFIEASEGTELDTIVYTNLGDPLKLMGKIAIKWLDGPKTEIPPSTKTVSISDFIQNRKGLVPEMPSVFGTDKALMLSSGGTSGKVKEIVISNLNANASALQAQAMIDNMEEGNCKTLTVMPLFHGFGLIGNLHMMLTYGGCCEMIPRFNPGMFAELIGAVKPDVIMGVPTLYQYLFTSDALKGMDLSFLKTVIVGGDALTSALRRKIEETFAEHGCNTVVRDGYGLTECVMLTCMTPKNGCRDGYIGIPCPDTFFKIVETGTEEEKLPGEVGQICISGPTVMQIYNDNREEYAPLRTHSDGMTWLHTGDLGLMDGDGYIAYRGRIDRMVISSGYNVYPNQVEEILNSHSAIDCSCVIGIPDEIKTYVVRAFIVLNKNVEKTDQLIKEIQRYCQDNLPRYSVPKDIRVVKSMPKTKVGKISYKDLDEETNVQIC
jgi:Acyl-CoA synthetases (AMP-forming)/AMP-acid ligases II